MPSWLVDDPSVIVVLLGLSALGLVAGWWFTRHRGYLLGLGVVVLLLVVVWLLYRFVDTDAKQIERKLHAMAAGVEAKNPDQIFTHISKDFLLQVQGTKVTKDLFRQRADGYIRNGEVTKIEVWNVDVRDLDRARKTATVFFRAKPKGTAFGAEYQFFNCRATFVLDPDDQWRLKDFLIFAPTADPATGESLELPR